MFLAPCTCSAKLAKLVINESVWQKKTISRKFSISKACNPRVKVDGEVEDGAGAVAWGNQEVYCPPGSILPSIALPSPLHCIQLHCPLILGCILIHPHISPPPLCPGDASCNNVDPPFANTGSNVGRLIILLGSLLMMAGGFILSRGYRF